MTKLLHGTTRLRAERISTSGPDPQLLGPDGFSTYLEEGPVLFGTPEDYACGKAAVFPAEGGAAILVVDVPESIVHLAVDEFFPLSQGLVQFDEAKGLAELRDAWPTLPKEIRPVQYT